MGRERARGGLDMRGWRVDGMNTKVCMGQEKGLRRFHAFIKMVATDPACGDGGTEFLYDSRHPWCDTSRYVNEGYACTTQKPYLVSFTSGLLGPPSITDLSG